LNYEAIKTYTSIIK